jgi:hypothetical protein
MDLHPRDLHPRDILAALLGRHTSALAVVHGCIDLAIQTSCAKWVDTYPDLRQVHGGVMAATVRQCLMAHLRCEEFKQSTLVANAGPNCSVVLSDVLGDKAVVRKHPRIYPSSCLVPVTEIPAYTLFGLDYSTCPWRPYVLWEPDLKTQVLRHAWLAAVANIDDPSHTEIYCELDLPPAIIPAVPMPPSGVDIEDEDWNEEFGQEEEGGADPA